jgi:hypothetical protein
MGGSASKPVAQVKAPAQAQVAAPALAQVAAPAQVTPDLKTLLDASIDSNIEYTRFIRKEKTELENILDKMKNFFLNAPLVYESYMFEFSCKPLINTDDEFVKLYESLKKQTPELLATFEKHIGVPLLSALDQALSEEIITIFIEKMDLIFNEIKYCYIPKTRNYIGFGNMDVPVFCRSTQYNFVNLFLNFIVDRYSQQTADKRILNKINEIKNLFKSLPVDGKELIPQLTETPSPDDEYDQGFTSVLNTPLPAYIEQRKGIMGLGNSKSERELKNARMSEQYINDMKPKIIILIHKGLNKAINDSKWFNNESDLAKGVIAEKLNIFETKIQNGLQMNNGIINQGLSKILTVDEVKNRLRNQYNLFKSIKNKIKIQKDEYLNYFFNTIEQFEGLANLGFPLVYSRKTGRKIKHSKDDQDLYTEYRKERKRFSRKQRQQRNRKTRKN